jgi:hypothetical protein
MEKLLPQTVTKTLNEERALALLGAGIAPETVAASLGVTPSFISQLLSEENFAAAVAELRFKNLSKHNERDNKYDELEDSLLSKLSDSLPLLQRPMEINKVLQTVNQAKRRGSSAPDSIIEKQSIISLTIPVQLIQQFHTNAQNQVVQAGEQTLLTMQSGSLSDMAFKLKTKLNKEGAVNDSAETFGDLLSAQAGTL